MRGRLRFWNAAPDERTAVVNEFRFFAILGATALTDGELLLTTVLAEPGNEVARLVLADILRESDDAEDQARGRFLWGGVIAAGFRDDEFLEDRLYYTAQEEIAAVASAGYPAKWLASIGVSLVPVTTRDWGWDCTWDRVTVRIGSITGIFARGMLCELMLTLGEWYAVATAALLSWPIELVPITDAPGLSFSIEKQATGWSLVARLKVPGRRVPLAGSVVPSHMSASPILTEGPEEWQVEELFDNRSALVAGVSSSSAALVTALKNVAGDRWPSPPRKRRSS